MFEPFAMSVDQPRDPHIILYAFGAVIGLFLLLGAGARLLRRQSRRLEQEIKLQEELARAEQEAAPKCVCGEIATEPMPILKRNRGGMDWLRSVFAAPPRYKRVIDRMQLPALCRTHAHVADSMLDRFIFTDIRALYAELNEKIAIRAAGFEQEELLKKIGESLTENQKRATRKSIAAVKSLPAKTGTDGESQV